MNPFAIPEFRSISEFNPPKMPPQGKRKYIIGGQIFYLVSKQELERDTKASCDAAIHLKKKRIIESSQKEVDKMIKGEREESMKIIENEWNKRESMFRTDDQKENFMNLLQFLLCVSSRVLIEDFHWKPIPKDGVYDKRNATMRFADKLVERISMICDDEEQDIIKYNDETYDLYGVKFTYGSDDEEE